MIKDNLNEREFELINIIGPELDANQRDLSRHINLSLGTTNMLIKRLIAKGYIRIRQLNKRKFKYLLTPKGLEEKVKKSIHYTLKTLKSITLIKEQLKEKIINKLYNQGIRDFIVLGRSDFALLIEIVLKELNLGDYTISYIEEMPRERVNGYLLICKEDVDIKQYGFDNAVDLIHELAKNGDLFNQNKAR